MKKWISVALALVLLVSIVPLDVFASDYRDLSTSQAMIDIIKDYEGFHPKPYWDNSQYTVGYGTCCGYTYDEIPEDILDGITEAEGEQMLREYLAEDAEPSVNEMFESMGLQPTQNQFDAMVDFTYNFGAYWWQYEDTRVEAAIASGIRVYIPPPLAGHPPLGKGGKVSIPLLSADRGRSPSAPTAVGASL